MAQQGDLAVSQSLPSDAVVLITGAARGLGRACAQRFASAGATVILTDVRAEEVEQLAASLREAGARATALAANLASDDSIDRLAAAASSAFGHLDVLVNNAGVILPKGLLAATAEEWDRMMSVNLRALFLLSRAVLPALRLRRGCIVNVASTAGLRAQHENGPYCTAKSGVIMLTQALAQEVLRDGVRVNCVCPSAIDTPLLAEYAHARGSLGDLDQLREQQLMLAPEEVADAIFFLAGWQARAITGQALVVDRGALLF
jgi:NAD(P)-dependent dehydrogenase (short-subunit alcohol dehydrogenase family)